MIDTTCALLILIPSGLMLIFLIIVTYVLSRQHQKSIEAINANQELIRYQAEAERQKEQDKKIFGLILQAHERLALFLERINPVNMIPRTHQPGQKVSQLEILLVNGIREEYEHNMSQQLYVSEKAWQLVKLSKEEIIKLVNNSAAKLDKNAPATDLAKEILTKGLDKEIKVLDANLAGLKKEMQQHFK